MKLYLVARYGNPESPEGPDGVDTVFLVCARTVDEAASLVDPLLKSSPDKRVKNWSHRVSEIGTAVETMTEPDVVMGPFLHYAIIANAPSWFREVKKKGWRVWEEA